MNTKIWKQYFLSNRHRFQEPSLPPHGTLLEDAVRLPLCRSLAVFQLGESGGGTRLLRYVRLVVHEDQLAGYEEAVALFVAEENYHASLLAGMVGYLGGATVQKQWTNSVFRWFRNCVGLEFNVQMLLIAELIAEVYYGLMYRRCKDPVLRLCCHKILSDEMRHIAFHTEFLSERLAARPPWWSWLWKAQFKICQRATACVVAFDHRPCFRALALSPFQVVHLAWRSGNRFLRKLSAPHELWRPGHGMSTLITSGGTPPEIKCN